MGPWSLSVCSMHAWTPHLLTAYLSPLLPLLQTSMHEDGCVGSAHPIPIPILIRAALPGTFWCTAESDLLELCGYYGLPAVSLKAAIHHLVRQGEWLLLLLPDLSLLKSEACIHIGILQAVPGRVPQHRGSPFHSRPDLLCLPLQLPLASAKARHLWLLPAPMPPCLCTGTPMTTLRAGVRQRSMETWGDVLGGQDCVIRRGPHSARFSFLG